MKLTTQQGIHFYPSFKEHFGEPEVVPAPVPPHFVLEKEMKNLEILEKINNEYCTLEHVAGFLQNPPEGTEDGMANIFYVKKYVKKDEQVLCVRVYWSAFAAEWFVFVSPAGAFAWSAGNRIFRNTPSDNDTKALDLALKVVQEAGYVVVKGGVIS